ncbi:MAG: sodium-dependent dicarboxylate transporter 2/3/5 [Hyphomicrobiaceae bacterium]
MTKTGMEVYVDTRPLWRIILDRSTKFAWLAMGVGAYFAISRMPSPEGLGMEGQQALAVFALCVIFWVTGALPLMITSLLAIALIPLSGVMTSSQAYSLFGNSAVFFILGAFILAACLMKSGLSLRMGLVFLQTFGHSPRTLLAATYLLNAIMAFFMSEHAVAAMNYPIVAEIVAVLGLRPMRSSYGKALFISLAWGSTIGGVATLLGGGRAPLALAMLQEATGEPSYTFATWSLYSLPIVAVMLAFGWVVLTRFFPIDIDSVETAESVLAERVHELGRMTGEERAIAIVMISTVFVWIGFGHELGLANVAIGAVVILFAFGLVAWKDVEEYVNWGIILMYGGAICLGAALDRSGAAAWLADNTLGAWAHGQTSIVASLSLITWLLTEAMSNSAVVALMMPITLGLAPAIGLPIEAAAPLIAIPAGLTFAFPIGTPANAIAYSSGFLKLRDLIVPGAIMGVAGWVVFNLTATFYWPILRSFLGTGL